MNSVFGEIRDELLELLAICALASLHLYLGDRQSAEQALQRAFTKSTALTMPDAKLTLWLTAARFYHLTGNDTEALAYATQCQAYAQATQQLQAAAAATLFCGFALERLARWPEANTAFAQALTSYQTLGMRPALADAQAGLARVALATGHPTTAQGWVEELLTDLPTAPTLGLDEPFLVYLTGHTVLTANGDGRAVQVRAAGVATLTCYAERIADRNRRTAFLTNVPTHAALLGGPSAGQ